MNPWLVAILSTSLDYSSTKYALSRNGIEANPIVEEIGLEPAKAIQIIMTAKTLEHLDKKHPKLSKKVKIGLFILNGIVAVHNIRQVN